jgi:hypothetical protein
VARHWPAEPNVKIGRRVVAEGSCSINYYYVNNASAGVYENPGSVWLKNKALGDSVTGTNSNLIDNHVNGWQAVYTSSTAHHVGWMWAANLTYLGCD